MLDFVHKVAFVHMEICLEQPTLVSWYIIITILASVVLLASLVCRQPWND